MVFDQYHSVINDKFALEVGLFGSSAFCSSIHWKRAFLVWSLTISVLPPGQKEQHDELDEHDDDEWSLTISALPIGQEEQNDDGDDDDGEDDDDLWQFQSSLLAKRSSMMSAASLPDSVALDTSIDRVSGFQLIFYFCHLQITYSGV